jgi:hypothetical protein
MTNKSEIDHEELIRYIKGVRRIVINAKYGGFSLSLEATQLYLKRSMIKYTTVDRASRDETTRYGPLILVDTDIWENRNVKRDDPVLVDVVRDLKEKANGQYAKLKIVEIPADVKWAIAEIDGREWIEEVHRTWE